MVRAERNRAAVELPGIPSAKAGIRAELVTALLAVSGAIRPLGLPSPKVSASLAPFFSTT